MKTILVTTFFLLLLKNVFSQAGMLDSTFSSDGIVTLLPEGYGNSAAIQSDGKILVGGDDGNGVFTVVRFNSNGNLDSSFGVNGIAKGIAGIGYNQNGRIAIQSDGKIVMGGTCVGIDGHWYCGLVRFNTNGTLDNSFNGNGKVIYSFTDPDEFSNAGFGVAITPDQKIVTIGTTSTIPSNTVFATARFNSNGSFDNTFGINGIVLTPVGNDYAEALAVAVQGDGKIVVGGGSYSSNNNSSFAIVRYNTNGILDNSFSNDGIDTIYFGTGSSGFDYDFDVAFTILIQSDNKITIAGYSALAKDTIVPVAIARYNSDGSLDTDFGIGGKTTILIPDNSSAIGFAISIQNDSKLLITGQCAKNNNSAHQIFLMRILNNGSLDIPFGTNGVVITTVDTTNGVDNWAEAVVIDQDQKIVVTGQSYLGMTVLRYLSGLNVGIINLTTSDAPPLIYPNPIHSTATLEYTLMQNQSISIILYNLLGEVVQTFITNQQQNAGSHKEVLNFNEQIVAGAYLLSISNGVHEQVVKVTVAK